MTKEELEKEITEYLNTQTLPKIDSLVYRVIKNLIFGFTEPREKCIAELEKELEQAKKVQVVEHFEAYGQCRDSRRIAGLEQELKSEKEYSANLRKEIDEYTNSHTLCAKFNELKEQNNKAKEIIRGLYFIIQGRIDYENNIGIADEMWRAKQFLKECENER